MKTNETHSNFWFGFAIGVCAASAGAYALGTKQGRSMLKKAMETCETLTESHHDIAELITEFAQKFQMNTQEDTHAKPQNSIASLMSKMKQKGDEKEQKSSFFKKK